MSFADEWFKPPDETLPARRNVSVSKRSAELGYPQTGLTPYVGDRYEDEVEEARGYFKTQVPGQEDFVEGDFRYVDDTEPEVYPDTQPEAFSESDTPSWKTLYENAGADEARRDQERVEKRALELDKLRWDLERAKGRAALRKLGESKFQRFERGLDRVGGVSKRAYRVATLGGPVKVKDKERYIPTGMQKLTSPQGLSGARRLTSIQALKESREVVPGAPLKDQSKVGLSSLRELSRPKKFSSLGKLRDTRQPVETFKGVVRDSSYGRLREAGKPSNSTPIVQASLCTGAGVSSSASPIALRALDRTRDKTTFESLRSLTVPKGMTPLEREVYSTVRETPGADSKRSLIEELAVGQYTRGDVSSAVEALVRRGLVTESRTHSGEPVLEVR